MGDAFINLVRMIIGPIIFCSVVHGVAGMNDMKRVGRVALKALGYFLAITLVALVFALIAVNLWKPGVGMNVDATAIDTHGVSTYTAQAGKQTITQFLLNIIPDDVRRGVHAAQRFAGAARLGVVCLCADARRRARAAGVRRWSRR